MTECEAPNNRPASNALNQRNDFSTFVRYAVVGLVQNAAFYGLGLILIYSGFTAWQATLILFPIAVVFSFLVNRAWSFAGRRQSPAEFRKYLFVYVTAYPVAVAMTWAQERAGVASWLASLITLAVAAIGIFLVLNHWVFQSAPAPD